MRSEESPCIIVLTAASGSGKTTLARRLMKAEPSIRFSVSATTRPPRPGERDGVDYHFLTDEQFEDARDRGEFLEIEEVYPGRTYGTLKSEVENSTAREPVLLDIEVIGAERVKQLYGERVLTVFIKPPSLEVLRQRLESRSTETPRSMAVRLERAAMEIGRADRFDVTVVNDDLKQATRDVVEHVRKFLGDC